MCATNVGGGRYVGTFGRALKPYAVLAGAARISGIIISQSTPNSVLVDEFAKHFSCGMMELNGNKGVSSRATASGELHVHR